MPGVVSDRDSHDTCKKVLAAIPNIIRTYPQQCAFGGCREATYPWQLSTDTSQGPTTIEYTISHSIEKSESVTEGWAVGGTAGFTLGPFATAGVCFQLGSHHYWFTTNYLCFPLRAIMVKSPDSPSPLIRVPRTWANGTPAPPTTMSGGTRSDAAHDHHA
jgi:hypothetical protein